MFINQVCGRPVRSDMNTMWRASGETDGYPLARALAVSCRWLLPSALIVQMSWSPLAYELYTIVLLSGEKVVSTPTLPVPEVRARERLASATGPTQTFDGLSDLTTARVPESAVRLMPS